MPGRSINSDAYRYGGAGGQEKDDEIAGSGNSYTAMYWQYDSRLMRRWNVDPITYPWQSPYATFNNNPIIYVDPLGLEGERKKPNLFQKFKAAIGIGRIAGTKKAGNQRYIKNRNWKPSAPAAGGGAPAGDGAPAAGGDGGGGVGPVGPVGGSQDISGTPGGGVGPGQRRGTPNGGVAPGQIGPNPRTPANPNGVQSRPNLGMQAFQLPGLFTSNNSSNYNRAAGAPRTLSNYNQIGQLYTTLSQTRNRGSFNVEALEVHIFVGIDPAMIGVPYTLRNGTVLAAPTANQILNDRAAVIRAALMRQGIPSDKIIWDITNMGGVSGGPFVVPATNTGRFSGGTGRFPAAPRTSHGVVFR